MLTLSDAKIKLTDCFGKYELLDECWEWTGSCGNTNGGYGLLVVEGKTWGAHRLSYALFNGELKEGMVIMHTCDNPCCVNPNHLKQGTTQENTRDAWEKGRFFRPGTKRGRRPKFRKAEVVKILKDSDTMTIKELSIKYDAGVSTIKRITNDNYVTSWYY